MRLWRPNALFFLRMTPPLPIPLRRQKGRDRFFFWCCKDRPTHQNMRFFPLLLPCCKESTLSPRLISLHPADAAFCKQAGRRLGLSEEAVITADGEAALPSLLPRAKLVLSNRLHAGVAALAAGVPSFLFPQSEKISAFSEDVSRVAREMALPSPVRLLSFSFSRLPSDTLEKEDILRLKGRLLGRCRLFSPFSTQE